MQVFHMYHHWLQQVAIIKIEINLIDCIIFIQMTTTLIIVICLKPNTQVSSSVADVYGL